jgi:hypothetical protein
MSDETRIGKVLEDRVTEIEKSDAKRDVREARMEVKVEVATFAMNRLTGLVGAAGIAILGAVIAFILTGSN